MDQTSPGETFRVLKEKEEKQYGEYRTRRLEKVARSGNGYTVISLALLDRFKWEINLNHRGPHGLADQTNRLSEWKFLRYLPR
jgi:hypothetical protein